MVYKTLMNTFYKADNNILLYIKDGLYIIRLVGFGNEITFNNRFAFEAWLMSSNCHIYTEIKQAA